MNVRTLQEIVDQCLEDSQTWFPGVAVSLNHYCLALAGEVGELCNVVKKIDRGSTDERCAREMLVDEVADVFIYLCNIAAVLNMDLEREYDRKRGFNAKRFDPEPSTVQ